MDIQDLQRDNIKQLKPYSTARAEFKGNAEIFLDANENPYGSPLPQAHNRYPDPIQAALKERIAQIKGIPAKHIFIGNGSDEAIDLIIRAFCEPKHDNIIIMTPTYGMYEVSAQINNVEIKRVSLTPDFQLDLNNIAETINSNTKVVFICSPNNPTGNSIKKLDIETLLNNFQGLVVVDEAYINYSKQYSIINELTEYPNLVVLQTFSKAWGLAGLRIGMAFGSLPLIEILNKVKPPYNLSEVTQKLAIEALDNLPLINSWIKETVVERELLKDNLIKLDFVVNVYPSDANFLLVKFNDANAVYNYLLENGIIVRNRSSIEMCENTLRISIGTPQENEKLIACLTRYNVA